MTMGCMEYHADGGAMISHARVPEIGDNTKDTQGVIKWT
jgi:hypothetical protein